MWIPRETVDAIGEGRGLWPYESYRVSYVSLQGYDASHLGGQLAVEWMLRIPTIKTW